ncbi:MAG: 5-formyltetrahydrofolate cyclo-ligase [Betaproteobacteria bacterium]|nr:5-formyltetrahydrofolate cyclo-ligase [Betaproteobacteria bacterium]
MTSGAALSPEALKHAKAALRQTILALRDAADAASRSSNSQTITQKLSALPAYRAANVVAAYASFGSELDTSEFLARVLTDGKQLLLPRINRAQRALELRHAIDLGADLVSGVWGIREPAERCPIVSVTKVEFILVPGVAFTARGARLGYGGGFYDRLLASLDRRIARIAAVFELQVVDHIPEGAHDQRVDQVVTEK